MGDAGCACVIHVDGEGWGGWRVPHPASRIPPSPARDQIVNQPLEWIESDHVSAIGHEIRERVDVVEVMTAVAVVDEVLDAADVEAHALGNSFDLPDDLTGWLELFDTHAVFLGVDGAGTARKLFAVGGLADVGRAEIEGIFCRVNVDCVKKLSVENFHARDVRVAQRRQLLDERHSVDAKVDHPAFRRLFERRRIVKTGDAGATATDVRLDDNRVAQTTSGVWSERSGDDINFCLANDRATLVWLANLACLEMHTLLSRDPKVDSPTAMVFDLDPGEPANVIDSARIASPNSPRSTSDRAQSYAAHAGAWPANDGATETPRNTISHQDTDGIVARGGCGVRPGADLRR